MKPSAALSVLGWLIRDTFRQALASGVFWLMLGVSAACVAVCLSVRVAGDPGGVRLELGFGAVRLPPADGAGPAVRALEAHLAGWVAGACGLLLALMWTAGFLPTFLEAGAAAVLLAKPVPRGGLLAGKCLGVLAFVALQAALFVGGTWLALGLRTGVWDPTYLVCAPLLVLHFAVFFSFSAVLAVATRSTVACVFGSIVFWLLCWAMNFGRHSALVLPELGGALPSVARTLELGYWLLPKPLDFHIILLNALQPDHSFTGLVNTRALAERGAWAPVSSVLASVACAAALLVLAGYDFVTAEY
jgi:hypothetical protein